MARCKCVPLKEAVDLETGEILVIVQSDIKAPWRVVCRSASGESIVQYVDMLCCKHCLGAISALDGFSTFMCSAALSEMYTQQSTEHQDRGERDERYW